MSTMTSAQFVFYLTCLFLGKMAKATDQKFSSSVRQDRHFVSANVGGNLTLPCFYKYGDATRIYWYKQSLGRKPIFISTKFVPNRNQNFHDEFMNNPRFTVDSKIGNNHLKITDLHISDSATYYCARRRSLIIEFSKGIIVSVKGSGSNIKALLHRSASDTIQPGGSVTLNCTVHTGPCDGEHSLYWFKNPEESSTGLIYTHGGRNAQCERKPNTQTHTCVYNLPKESLNLSEAGTYCAVASCGHILFGNGTKLDFDNGVDFFVLVYFLSGALTVTTILVFVLVYLIYKMNKTRIFRSGTESQAGFSAPSIVDTEGHRDTESLHYAAVNVKRPNRSRRQRDNTKTDCVYSSVKL